jgi:hypothetical protein
VSASLLPPHAESAKAAAPKPRKASFFIDLPH